MGAATHHCTYEAGVRRWDLLLDGTALLQHAIHTKVRLLHHTMNRCEHAKQKTGKRNEQLDILICKLRAITQPIFDINDIIQWLSLRTDFMKQSIR